MIVEDMIFLRKLGDPYSSCWVQTLFANGRPMPKRGFIVGERLGTLEWEEDWSNPLSYPPKTSDCYWEQIIYSGVFVRGANCSLKQSEGIEHNTDLLVSSSRISLPVKVRKFVGEWLLEGCSDLPQLSAVLNDVSGIQGSLEVPSSDQLRNMAMEIGPRPGARLGFTRHHECGALTFLEKLAPRKFLVESLSVIDEGSDQSVFYAQYSSAAANKSVAILREDDR